MLKDILRPCVVDEASDAPQDLALILDVKGDIERKQILPQFSVVKCRCHHWELLVHLPRNRPDSIVSILDRGIQLGGTLELDNRVLRQILLGLQHLLIVYGDRHFEGLVYLLEPSSLVIDVLLVHLRAVEVVLLHERLYLLVRLPAVTVEAVVRHVDHVPHGGVSERLLLQVREDGLPELLCLVLHGVDRVHLDARALHYQIRERYLERRQVVGIRDFRHDKDAARLGVLLKLLYRLHRVGKLRSVRRLLYGGRWRRREVDRGRVFAYDLELQDVELCHRQGVYDLLNRCNRQVVLGDVEREGAVPERGVVRDVLFLDFVRPRVALIERDNQLRKRRQRVRERDGVVRSNRHLGLRDVDGVRLVQLGDVVVRHGNYLHVQLLGNRRHLVLRVVGLRRSGRIERALEKVKRLIAVLGAILARIQYALEPELRNACKHIRFGAANRLRAYDRKYGERQHFESI